MTGVRAGHRRPTSTVSRCFFRNSNGRTIQTSVSTGSQGPTPAATVERRCRSGRWLRRCIPDTARIPRACISLNLGGRRNGSCHACNLSRCLCRRRDHRRAAVQHPQSIPQAFDRMRGHGGPAADELAEIVRSASKHPGPWPTLSIWHGSNDRTVDPSNAEDLVDQWRALHGATKRPTRTDRVGGYPHRVWCDAEGREVIEEYVIAGMGHGAPLSTKEEQLDEVAGPYMLEAGISSTRGICRFWGLCDERIPRAGKITASLNGKSRASHGGSSSRQPSSHPLGDGIAKTIEDALRAAGLMGCQV